MNHEESLLDEPVDLVVRCQRDRSVHVEAIETAFTGRSSRWEGRSAVWRGEWRNLHDGAQPKIDVRLSVGGDPEPSRLTCSWPGEDVTVPEIEVRRPGHGRIPLAAAGWERPLSDYRPFLSYSDLDRMISGRPSDMYDAVATILGLRQLKSADDRLQAQEKTLDAAVKSAKAEVPELLELLAALDDPRAAAALAALRSTSGPDLDTLAALVDGLPGVDDACLAVLRAAAALTGPDLDQVGPAVDRLREAAAALDDVRASGAEDAHQRAELLGKALEHSRRHAGEESCPVCGSDRVLDAAWAERANEQLERLRLEAAAAQQARTELHNAMDTLRYLIAQPPAHLPASLVEPWQQWTACRSVTEPEQLAVQAEHAALVLAEGCAVLREEAARELEKLDEGWRRCVARLASWVGRARAAYAGEARLREVRAARTWLKEAAAGLREERLRPVAAYSQRIWQDLRQESNVDLQSIRLTGSDKASVRKLALDVAVDGESASALGVMSQGELHSVALALFLPRAAAPDSPFGFVVVDDPVQSMDPAKVHGLAKVLHDLGASRQVIVFTHDTRLQRAFANQDFPVTVLEVERRGRSVVNVRRVADPIAQALDDARALASTTDLPPAAISHVLPGICRTVLERAFTEAAWQRLHRAGLPERQAQEAVASAHKLMDIAALGLLGDASRTGEVYRELRRRCGPRAVDVLRQCQEGAHLNGTSIPVPHRFVDAIESLAQQVRKPEEQP